MTTYKNILLGIALIAVIGLATWMTLSNHAASPIAASSTPDGYMEKVTATIMDKQGRIHLKLVTDKMVHYADHDTMQIAAPELTFYRNSPKPWYIHSKYAKSTDGMERVIFWDNVMVHQPAYDTHAATVINTTSLVVYPSKQIAETADHITLTQPNLIIQALGMHANMTTGEISLLAQAEGEYAPTK